MSIAEMQDCLAALYLDAPLRRQFYDNPESVLQDYQLDEPERTALRKLDASGLELYAATLRAKRRKRLVGAFPSLFAADAQLADRCFARYVSLYVQRPNQSIHEDVNGFGFFAQQFLLAACEVPEWLPEVVRYEHLWYAARHSPTHVSGALPDRPGRPVLAAGVVLSEFQYNVQAIVTAIRGGKGMVFKPDPVNIVFRAVTPQSPCRLIRISDATRMLLSHCDGHRNVGELIAVIERELRQSNMARKIRETLDRLVDHGVIRLPTGDDPVERDADSGSARDGTGMG